MEIMRYFLALERMGRSPRDKIARTSERIVQDMTSPRARHANCLRSFRRVYDSDRSAAERVFHACTRLVKSFSP